uniref:Uncharacterized protein n=1 Tax=Rhizophora mucronata TaxID=61149 RepID=A0A2P2IK14_RHIMU
MPSLITILSHVTHDKAQSLQQ